MTTTFLQSNDSLIPFTPQPVLTQGNVGDCVECATTNLIALTTSLYGPVFNSNAEFQYNLNLQAQGQLGVDAGTNVSEALSLLQTSGLTQNTTIQYGDYTTAPGATDLADAATHTVTGITPLTVLTGSADNWLANEIAGYLNQMKPLLMEFEACAGFFAEETISNLANQNGMDTGAAAGLHEVAIVAVNTNTDMLTVESWGSAYGAKGLFQISLSSFDGAGAINLLAIDAINGFNGIDLTQNSNTQAVSAAFVAILGRASALSGMTAFSAALNNGAMTVANMCDSIFASSEAQADFAGMTNTQIINQLYQNVLGRNALPAGMTALLGELAGGATIGAVAAQIITAGEALGNWSNTFEGGVWSGTNNDPNMMTESGIFQNKIQVAEDAAIAIQAGQGNNATLHNILTTVTADQSTILASLVGVPQQLQGASHVAIHS